MPNDFENCIIIYKSGDGKSFIEHLWIDHVKIYPSEEETQQLEDEYGVIIFENDHDRETGYGRIVIKNGNVIEQKYQEN